MAAAAIFENRKITISFYFINMFQVNSCIHTPDTRQKDKIHQIGHILLNLRKFTVTIASPLLRNALPTYLCVLPNKKFSVTDIKNTYLKLWYNKPICQ